MAGKFLAEVQSFRERLLPGGSCRAATEGFLMEKRKKR